MRQARLARPKQGTVHLSMYATGVTVEVAICSTCGAKLMRDDGGSWWHADSGLMRCADLVAR